MGIEYLNIKINDNYRLIGCFGNESVCNLELGKSPELKPGSVFGDGATTFAIRRGRPLIEAEDLMFSGPRDQGLPDDLADDLFLSRFAPMQVDELEDILEQARSNNSSNGITGARLH